MFSLFGDHNEGACAGNNSRHSCKLREGQVPKNTGRNQWTTEKVKSVNAAWEKLRR